MPAKPVSLPPKAAASSPEYQNLASLIDLVLALRSGSLPLPRSRHMSRGGQVCWLPPLR
jgi:hypothetical protein